MKLSELSAEDQKLVATQFSPELEKEAGEHVKVAQECYSNGFNKFAAETAEALEKLAEDEEKEESEHKEEKKLDEHQEKEAAARGAFIARGYIDGLKKLGAEKYQDEMAYLWPFVNEKLAMLGKAMDFAKATGGKALAAAAAHPKATAAATHGAAALGGAAGLKGLQMMGRKKETPAQA